MKGRFPNQVCWTAAIGPAAAVLAALVGCGAAEEPAPATRPLATAAAPAAPQFVGGARCGACHPQQAERWRGSHHDRAMEVASESTVLGDFRGARYERDGAKVRFLRRDGGFVVRAEGPGGHRDEFEVAFTIGFEPLQQLLLPLPGGRLQAFTIAWDARSAERGGGRWFSLYPGERIAPGDPLHWSAPAQNWNARCAECHTTGLRKSYSVEEDRYDTTWSEIDVSCEACHGPGSAHVAWAEDASRDVAAGDHGLPVDFAPRGEAVWRFAPGEPIARRDPPPIEDAELATCARCHARRAALRAEERWGRPLLDTHLPALLDEGLYHADGQILDEVYVWGSFAQSRMAAAGVACSDCHDPHALRIDEPDAVCAQCHRPEVFAAAGHHHHDPGGPGASCVACHMPERTYMVIDPRRDHSLRVPRPDLSVAIGTPNACSGCHAERSAEWAAEAAERWWELAARPHYGEALHAGRAGLPGAERALARLVADAAQPAIARATALRLLGGLAPPNLADAVAAALPRSDALVRFAAAEASEAIEPRRRLALVEPLLRDPTLGVRIQAARALADVAPGLWRAGARARLGEGLAEYRAAQRAQADTPEAHLNLAALHAQFGEIERARAELETALRLAPWFVPAHVNLADLHRQAGREAEAERALRRGLEIAPESPDLHHALGLALVRQQRRDEALAALERATARAPERPRHALAYALALHAAGRTREALAQLERARTRRPTDREILYALSTLSRDAGERDAALRHAREMAALRPDDPVARRLLAELEAHQGDHQRGRR